MVPSSSTTNTALAHISPTAVGPLYLSKNRYKILKFLQVIEDKNLADCEAGIMVDWELEKAQKTRKLS
ncbi:hypothetical protein ACJX0J_034642, partial [Zea mays]